MPTDNNFIVAIELGSSKVTGIAGKKQPDGGIQILAVVQEPSAAFIRKGRINNVMKMKTCIVNIKKKLEETLKKSINQTYVGVGGMGMHTIPNKIVKNFSDKTMITEEIIDAVRDENLQMQSAERDILEAVTQEYKLGAQTTLEPVGIQTESIEGHFLNVVTKKEVCDNIKTCFHEAGLDVVDIPITFLALGENMLTEQQRLSGCVFVDMGSETTSVAIYKNGILRHLAVIPLGGENITRDIASLQIERSEAEQLKLNFGSALTEENNETHSPIKLQRGDTVSYEEFSGLIEARQEEIIENVAEQIKLSKFDKTQLIGGIIVTGGASNMKNIDKAFAKYTGFDHITFVKSINTPLRLSDALRNFNRDGASNSAIALIEKGDENCCGGEIGEGQNELFPTKEKLDRLKAEEEARKLEEAKRKANEEAQLLQIKEKEEAEARQKAEAERESKRQKRQERFNRFKRWLNDLVSDKEN